MIVESSDGKFYLNPQFCGPRWVVRFDERPELQYQGNSISWKTARKVLRPVGIRAKLKAGPYDDQQILGCKLLQVTTYELQLNGPIPTPHHFEAVLDSRPADGEFEIISWRKK